MVSNGFWLSVSRTFDTGGITEKKCASENFAVAERIMAKNTPAIIKPEYDDEKRRMPSKVVFSFFTAAEYITDGITYTITKANACNMSDRIPSNLS